MIEINNLTNFKIDKKFLQRVCQKILKGEKEKSIIGLKNERLSIAFIDREKMIKLNKRYLGRNQATDVLTFSTGIFNEQFFQEGLGEIIICPWQVKQNAKKFKSPFEKELLRVLIHGLLHLLGYTHGKSKKESEKMEEKENYYLKLWQRL